MSWWYYVASDRSIFVAEAENKEEAATELLTLSGEQFDNPTGPFDDQETAQHEAQYYVDDLELADEDTPEEP